MSIASRLPAIALILSLSAAVLSLVSGTSILEMLSVPRAGNMGMIPPGFGMTLWALLLYGVAGLLIVTGVLGLTRVGMRRRRRFGGMMVIYAVVMLLVGASMLTGVTPMMQALTTSGTGMLLIGVAMMVNGMLMAASPKLRQARAPYLICETCGYEQEIPQHHEAPMQVHTSGAGEVEKLTCRTCGHEITSLTHCGPPLKLLS